MKRLFWHTIVMLLVVLIAFGAGQLPVRADDLVTTMDGTISGSFLNAATNQFESTTLAVPSSATDYYYGDEEQYSLHATFTTQSNASATQDFTITTRVTYNWSAPPSSQVVWGLTITPGQITIGGGSYPIHLRVDDQGRMWFGIGPIEFQIRDVPNPGSLTVTVYTSDREANPISNQPLGGAIVELYVDNQLTRKPANTRQWQCVIS